MRLENLGGFNLSGLSKANIILGKNGCGKSHLLKQIETSLRGREGYGAIRYISPERAGILEYSPNVDNNINQNPSWMADTRRQNQATNFKEQSAVLFRRLELLFLRELQDDHTKPGYEPRHFNQVLARVNTLLDRVELVASNKGFDIREKETNNISTASAISSGEAELISLSIEFLSFVRECDPINKNFLLVDEPDVHLHPDLQERLARFIVDETNLANLYLIVATHSTPFVSALRKAETATVSLMKRGDRELTFKPINEVVQRILPMFGAHPLSNVFAEAPILLVEGEDDDRIWQQAVRTSNGQIKVYPCVTETVARQGEYEIESDAIIQSVYDNATGYSLRDRDGHPEEIDDIGRIIRMRLSCRAAENLMLSDDVFRLSGIDWNIFQDRIKNFVEESKQHPYYAQVKAFHDEGRDRKMANVKPIRNLLASFMTTKPWEVLVGQAIAHVALGHGLVGEHSLSSYLGRKACRHLLKLQATE